MLGLVVFCGVVATIAFFLIFQWHERRKRTAELRSLGTQANVALPIEKAVEPGAAWKNPEPETQPIPVPADVFPEATTPDQLEPEPVTEPIVRVVAEAQETLATPIKGWNQEERMAAFERELEAIQQDLDRKIDQILTEEFAEEEASEAESTHVEFGRTVQGLPKFEMRTERKAPEGAAAEMAEPAADLVKPDGSVDYGLLYKALYAHKGSATPSLTGWLPALKEIGSRRRSRE